MARVYRAHDSHLECDVAIKFISQEVIDQSQWKKMRIRFDHEAKQMAKLNHPHIVRVIDYGEYEGIPYLVMPCLAGGSLKDTVKSLKGKPLDYHQAGNLLIPIARALDYVHKNGTVHRDIKPANILLTEAGQPMLTDFGVAKIFDAEGGFTLTGIGGVGTPKYMAPEQWDNKITPQVDVYSLGVVLYELVTGQLPYQGDTPATVLAKQKSEPLPSPRQFNPSLPLSVELVIAKALAVDPRQRYSSMAEFAEELEKICRVNNDRYQPAIVEEKKPTKPQKEAIYQSKVQRKSVYSWQKPLIIVGILLFGVVILGGICSLLVVKPDWLVSFPKGKTQTAILTDSIGAEKKPQLTIEKGSNSMAGELNVSSVNPIDGAMMMYVPAGEFLMGSVDDDVQALESEKPQHAVYLNDYWIYKTEVSNRMYKKCVKSGKCTPPIKNDKYDKEIFLDHPVENVRWEQANAYCQWAGGRLPTEAEWEKAARGVDARKYPWGNKSPEPGYANYKGSNLGGAAIVGSFLKDLSPYGVLDMAGNVQEWVQDWYSGEYYRNSPRENPTGPETGNARVVRGGSWRLSEPVIRTAMRLYLMPAIKDFDYHDIGFRCVKEE